MRIISAKLKFLILFIIIIIIVPFQHTNLSTAFEKNNIKEINLDVKFPYGNRNVKFLSIIIY